MASFFLSFFFSLFFSFLSFCSGSEAVVSSSDVFGDILLY